MNTSTTTVCDGHHHKSTTRDVENNKLTSETKCDCKISGLRNTSHLHAEHDIAKLRVLQSTGAPNGHDTMAKKYAMSVMAASVAETVTYPLD